ncbi:MAG TPA: TIGR03618 family F420-dependent PPOX class oxidoreductase [Candidatus Binatia bacterium]|nr:TIGR03618 family F420-dependent PPOX class oxidoreductase [Candidatus Binatia bacterium]
MSLDDPRVQQFLAGKQTVVLATVQPDGAPLATAMWLVADPAALTMISVADLQKVRNLQRDPRVSVVADAIDPIRGVALQGRAEFLPDGAERRALVDRFHAKYPGLAGLWKGRAMPADRVMFRITPARVRAWGFE